MSLQTRRAKVYTPRNRPQFIHIAVENVGGEEGFERLTRLHDAARGLLPKGWREWHRPAYDGDVAEVTYREDLVTRGHVARRAKFVREIKALLRRYGWSVVATTVQLRK